MIMYVKLFWASVVSASLANSYEMSQALQAPPEGNNSDNSNTSHNSNDIINNDNSNDSNNSKYNDRTYTLRCRRRFKLHEFHGFDVDVHGLKANYEHAKNTQNSQSLNYTKV